MNIVQWITSHWIAIVPIVWTIDQLLKLICKLTPTLKDDNVADIIGSWIAKLFPKAP